MKAKHIAIEIMPRAMWIIQGIVLFLAHYMTGYHVKLTDNFFILLAGIILVISGLFMLIDSFYFLLKPMFTKELMTNGPYKYARHPMYVSIYLLLSGVGLMFFSSLWFVILLAFVPLWYIDCKIEEGQMIDLHGDKYREYMKKTAMYWPRKIY